MEIGSLKTLTLVLSHCKLERKKDFLPGLSNAYQTQACSEAVFKPKYLLYQPRVAQTGIDAWGGGGER